MLSNATGCPNCGSKKLPRGFFNMWNPNLPSDLLSDHSGNTSFEVNLEMIIKMLANQTTSYLIHRENFIQMLHTKILG